MPNVDALVALGRRSEFGHAIGAGLYCPWRVHHTDEGHHLVVDVATERGDPGRLKGDDALLFATVQFQLELVSLRKRVDMMPELIEVRKLDRRSNRRDQDEWRELLA